MIAGLLATLIWSRYLVLNVTCFRAVDLSRRSYIMSMSSMSFLSDVRDAISESLGRKLGDPALGGSYGGGGGGCSTGEITFSTGESFFYKRGGIQDFDMLRAEYEGNKAMAATKTIRVPTPIVVGTSDYSSYAVFEKLNLGGRGSGRRYAEQLCAMHKCSSPDGRYGFHINNTCGATPQINTPESTWADFWCKHRLGSIMSMAKYEGATFSNEAEIMQRTHDILTAHEREHDLKPSLVHGDLWSGNQAFTKEGDACIFDPATYYGDREVDIAMTRLFGCNSREFYDTYNAEWPMPEGWEERQVIYNAYHILNHYVLFGGGYLQQGKSMLERVLRF
jgi:protein-ribulosamine 3-kinase